MYILIRSYFLFEELSPDDKKGTLGRCLHFWTVCNVIFDLASFASYFLPA